MRKSSLTALAHRELMLAGQARNGRSAHTVYGGHEHVLRQTVIALTAGQTLAEHTSPGEATVYVLQGRVRLTSEGESWQASSGDLLIVPDGLHTLTAMQDAVVLLTVGRHR
jgi:quercetin dioxygenase-like cupin family protein